MQNMQSRALPKDVSAEALWRHYFRFDSLQRGDWRARRCITTDAVGCTVKLARPLRDGEVQRVKDRDDGLFAWRRVPDLESCRVVAVDPGRRDLFTALKVEVDPDDPQGVRSAKRVPHTHQPQKP